MPGRSGAVRKVERREAHAVERSYVTLTIKAIDEDKRELRGVATTPTPDRLSDIVEPMGVEFKNPMPLLWQHRQHEPVGEVWFDKPTKDGIKFRAVLPQVDVAGKLKDRIDEAWQSVKLGLVKAVSIGFMPIEWSWMDDGGIRFVKSEVFELSLVTIPANAEATIQQIKAFDRRYLAASGRNTSPGVAGTLQPPKKDCKDMSTLQQRMEALRKQIDPLRLRMKEIQDAADAEANGQMSAEQGAEFDEIADEVGGLEVQLRRLDALSGSAGTARAVAGATVREASDARGARLPAEAAAHEEKGQAFARYVMLRTFAATKVWKGEGCDILSVAKGRYPNLRADRRAELEKALRHGIAKAQVAGAATDDPAWAGNLVEPTVMLNEFLEYLRPRTIVGRFGQGGIPSLRAIPFNVKIRSQTVPGEGYWVGEGRPKPVTKFGWVNIVLRWTKVANIAVLSEELIRFSTPSAETLVRDALVEALQARLDSDFINPSITATTDVRPASVTNGAATIAASGVTAQAFRNDMADLLGDMVAANVDTSSLVIIMRGTQALRMSMMNNELGQPEFPNLTLNGGTIGGVPVLVSQHVPAGVIVFAIASEIYLADDGGFDIDISREASVEMADNPTNAITDGASPPQPVEQAMISLWQTNSVGVRAERMINWARRRSAGVAYITGASYGSPDTTPPADPL